MALMDHVKSGKINLPILALIYGTDGVGKSTFGSEAPSPIFLATERGTANLPVERFDPEVSSFKEALQRIDQLIEEEHHFKTLVVDSLDWMEPLLWEQVCVDHNWKNIEDPGYGKGYVYAQKYWAGFIAKLSKLREKKKMNIILIALILRLSSPKTRKPKLSTIGIN
jgi:hypothetical protein